MTLPGMLRPAALLPFCLSFVLLCQVSSCSSCSTEKTASGSATASTHYPIAFPSVTVPSIMSGTEAVNYAAEHYWDAYLSQAAKAPCDSTVTAGVRNTDLESAMSDYVNFLKNIEIDEACRCIRSFSETLVAMERADSSSSVSETLRALFERYVFDPNSPVRDEDLYAPYALAMSACDLFPPEKQEAFATDAALCSLNRRGSPASDFRFSYKDGRRGHLYGIKAPFTLVFFSNPGCHACKQIIDVLSSPGPVAEMVAGGVLAVVNIYIDEDLGEWYKYMPIYPAAWHNVYDADYRIRGEELYNIRAIPSLYLLDASKTVLLKDAPENILYAALDNILSGQMQANR